MNQEERNTKEEYDEIDLMDYIKIIFKRKWLIFAIFILSVIVTGIVSSSLPKVYKIDASLEIGKIEEIVLENPGQTAEKIKGDVYGLSIRKELEISEKDYPKIKVNNPDDTDLITVEIESDENERAKDILERISELILEEHRLIIETKNLFFDKKIELLEENVKIVQKDIARIETKTFSLKKEQENLENQIRVLQETLIYEQTPGTQFALFNTKEKLETKIQEITTSYLEINSLETSLNSIQGQIDLIEMQIESMVATRIIKSSTISEDPVSPRLLLNIALAGILSIFMGTFFAFFKEWWERSK